MRKIIFVFCLLLVPGYCFAVEFTPDKQSTKVAEAHCQSLVYMTKTQTDASQILANVHATVKSGSSKGKKLIFVTYKYNVNGAMYFCAFVDYTRGRLQLAEFGEIWPDGNKNTIVKKLY